MCEKAVIFKEENMKKGIRNVVIVLYAIIAIFVTICLLSYNDYNVTEFRKLYITNNKG